MVAYERSTPGVAAWAPVPMAGKRAFDLVIGSVGLIVAAPVIVFLALWVWIQTGDSPIFRQVRSGKHNRPYRMYKLRSMSKSSDAVTSIGHHLRRTHLDELPQLINVLRGQMSLVGPRPIVVEEHEEQCGLNPYHEERLAVLPGMTGLSQVKAPRGTPDRQAIWDEQDREYVRTWSLWLDLKIICQTIPQVLGRRGA